MAKIINFQDVKNQKAYIEFNNLMNKACNALVVGQDWKVTLINREIDDFVKALDNEQLDYLIEKGGR